jgi:hypothetical protein
VAGLALFLYSFVVHLLPILPAGSARSMELAGSLLLAAMGAGSFLFPTADNFGADGNRRKVLNKMLVKKNRRFT